MIISISGITKQEVKEIDRAAARCRMSRSAFMINAALEKAMREEEEREKKYEVQ